MGTFSNAKYNRDNEFSVISYDILLAYGFAVSIKSRCSGLTEVSDRYRNSMEQAVNFKFSRVLNGPCQATYTKPQSSSSDG